MPVTHVTELDILREAHKRAAQDKREAIAVLHRARLRRRAADDARSHAFERLCVAERELARLEGEYQHIRRAAAPRGRSTGQHQRKLVRQFRMLRKNAKREVAHALSAFGAAMGNFKRASTAYARRQAALEEATAELRRITDELARAAGVPRRYVGNVRVRHKSSDGTSHLYFGGEGGPGGKGHAHYVINERGYMSYRREPGQPHGRRNAVKP